MDDDVMLVVVILLGVGVAAWLLTRSGAVAPPPPPCNVNVAYQGVGVGIPCGAVKEVLTTVDGVVKTVTGVGTKTLVQGITPFGSNNLAVCPPGAKVKQSLAGNVKVLEDGSHCVACAPTGWKPGDCGGSTTPPAAQTQTVEQHETTLNRYVTGTRIIKV